MNSNHEVPSMPIKCIASSCVLVHRGRIGKSIGRVRFLVGKRTDGLGWGFAAGKKEGYENSKQTAVRELEEEFDLKATAVDLHYIGQLKGFFWIKESVVFVNAAIYMYYYNYTNAASIPELFERNDEMEELKWVTLDQLLRSGGSLFSPTRHVIERYYDKIMMRLSEI